MPDRRLGPIDRDLLDDLRRVEREEAAKARADARAFAESVRSLDGTVEPIHRLGAAVVDTVMLGGIALFVLWATLRLCDVTLTGLGLAALVPLVVFLALMDLGYLLMFTAAGGQTPRRHRRDRQRAVDAAASLRARRPDDDLRHRSGTRLASSAVQRRAGAPRSTHAHACRACMKRVGLLIATSGGLGYVPFAPGTVGSAVGVVLYLLTSHWSFQVQLALAGGVTLVGVWAAAVAARYFGKPDPTQVVIDEVAGQLVTFLGTGVGPTGAVVGFLIFRALDIIKPWPANRL
jgi:phosphatidylglycerophosphatase A